MKKQQDFCYETDKMLGQILSQSVGSSPVMEQKIQSAYDTIRQREGRKQRKNQYFSRRKRLTVACAVGLAAALSLTAAALGGYFTKTVQEEGDLLTYTFQVDYDLVPHKVDYACSYIPDGWQEVEDSNHYSRTGAYDDPSGISIMLVTANTLRDGESSDLLTLSDVKSVEHTKIGGVEADVITRSYDPERFTSVYDKVINLFHPEEGFVANLCCTNDLSMEELIKVAEGLSFTVTEETLPYPTDEELEEEQRVDEASKEVWMQAQSYQDYGVPGHFILGIGDTFNFEKEIAQGMCSYLEAKSESCIEGSEGTWDSEACSSLQQELEQQKGVDYTVLSAEVLDSAAGYPTEFFYWYENFSASLLNADGSLRPYERVTYEKTEEQQEREDTIYGKDGAIYEEASRQEIGQKLLKVKIRAYNPADREQEIWAGDAQLVWLDPPETAKADSGAESLRVDAGAVSGQAEADSGSTGGSMETTWGPAEANYHDREWYSEPLNRQEYGLSVEREYPIYFDLTPYAGTKEGHFFYVTAQPQETLEYTLLYVIDEDQLDNLYLSFGNMYHPRVNLEEGIFYRRYVRVELNQ